MADLIAILVPFFLLVFGYAVGTLLERRHYRSIRSREERWMRFPSVTFRQVPSAWNVEEGALVSGSVVVSVDHFKRFLAGLRGIVGGRVKSYESILDRGRREALLRMKKHAIDQGFHAVVNVRITTTRMANGRRDGKGTAGLEILAFGTGLRLASRPS